MPVNPKVISTAAIIIANVFMVSSSDKKSCGYPEFCSRKTHLDDGLGRLTPGALSAMQTKMVQRILEECRQGKPLSKGESLFLSSVKGGEFTALLEVASEVRDRYKGRTITFSPKIFIPLTNLCRDFCGYCTFRKAPHEPGAKTISNRPV